MSDLTKDLDKMFDVAGLVAETAEVQENGGGEFPEVPKSNYEVLPDKFDIVMSKKGNPMLSIWFKIDAGQFKNSLLFFNQAMNTGFGIHLANEFLRSLDTGLEIEFKSFSQYADLLCDIKEACEAKGLAYNLEYGEKKGYSTFKVLEVFEG